MNIEDRLQRIEDKLALKNLVDTFSTLADIKDTKAQTLLFTEDAVVNSYQDGKLISSYTGRDDIGKAFAKYLSLFDTVYHINGQQTIQIDGDHATGTSYSQVILIGTQDGVKTQLLRGVVYHDDYVRQNGRWLIAKRESNFVWGDTKVDDR
ncbi:MAG: nuclear transport factor 2 family protein [Prevotella sp.]|nr:nuclear transport factor 2 family protein [Prevotella sp.]